MSIIPNISFQNEKSKSGFEVISLSTLFDRMPSFSDHNPYRPHRISFFALLLVSKGSGTHEIDLKTYELREGTVLKLAKGQVHAFQHQAQYDGFLIIFTEAFIINHFSKSSINLISHLYNYHLVTPIALEKTLNERFLMELKLELESHNSYAHASIIAGLVDLYLLRLERKVNHNESLQVNSKNYHAFVQFKNLVETKYITSRNVKDFAEMMFISTKRLNQVVKAYTLDTAKNFIDNYVLLESKRLIVSTQRSIKEIAFEVGFDEVTNFTKFFKNKTGNTPKAFQKSQT